MEALIIISNCFGKAHAEEGMHHLHNEQHTVQSVHDNNNDLEISNNKTKDKKDNTPSVSNNRLQAHTSVMTNLCYTFYFCQF